jgi:hypothetical protein
LLAVIVNCLEQLLGTTEDGESVASDVSLGKERVSDAMGQRRAKYGSKLTVTRREAQ